MLEFLLLALWAYLLCGLLIGFFTTWLSVVTSPNEGWIFHGCVFVSFLFLWIPLVIQACAGKAPPAKD